MRGICGLPRGLRRMGKVSLRVSRPHRSRARTRFAAATTLRQNERGEAGKEADRDAEEEAPPAEKPVRSAPSSPALADELRVEVVEFAPPRTNGRLRPADAPVFAGWQPFAQNSQVLTGTAILMTWWCRVSSMSFMNGPTAWKKGRNLGFYRSPALTLLNLLGDEAARGVSEAVREPALFLTFTTRFPTGAAGAARLEA